VKTPDADKTRMIGLPYGEKTMTGRFHLIPERHGQTDRIPISISCVSMRDKNNDFPPISRFISEMMQDTAMVTIEGE